MPVKAMMLLSLAFFCFDNNTQRLLARLLPLKDFHKTPHIIFIAVGTSIRYPEKKGRRLIDQ